MNARNTDPETSHQAAIRVSEFSDSHRARILKALIVSPAGQSEIAERSALLPHQVNKRLSDLENEGRIETTGNTVKGHSGRLEREWKCIPYALQNLTNIKGNKK